MSNEHTHIWLRNEESSVPVRECTTEVMGIIEEGIYGDFASLTSTDEDQHMILVRRDDVVMIQQGFLDVEQPESG